MSEDTELLSAKEAAIELGTDARTLRKFLRKRDGLVGQGQRWGIDPSEIDALKKAFNAGHKAPKAKTEKESTQEKPVKKPKKSAAVAPPDDEEEIDFDVDEDFEALDPDEDDLDELEDMDDMVEFDDEN